MRSIVLLIVAMMSAVLVSGCAGDLSLLKTLGDRLGVEPAEAKEKAAEIETKTLGNAAKALPRYCQAPLDAREVLRERLNERPESEGASLYVYCPGDPFFRVPVTNSD